jgi:flagellar motility protein MotE (MotC chaperone)
MDFQHLTTIRKTHPAWQLLRADNGPLIISFLYRKFIVPNARTLSQSDLEAKLEDELFRLREQLGEDAFPKAASHYLNDWTQNDKGWLRKFYPPGQDEAHFDLTPATEKAILWLESLTSRVFVGTESRLRTVFELLRQIVSGSDDDVETRIADLEKQKADLEKQIERLRGGEIDLLDDTALKDRFQQMNMLARSLLGDFREVEHNFRMLDRKVREQIATWEGRKGELLEKIFGEREAIEDTDQGRSFRAFWEFIMSPDRQEEFTDLIEKVLAMEPIQALRPDPRLSRIHFDWLMAGETTQRTVARLSQQLRRFLEDQTFLENRRIIQIFQQIEALAVKVHDRPPTDKAFMYINEPGAAAIDMPMERPLFKPAGRPRIESVIQLGDGSDIDTAALFDQIIVDKELLRSQIRRLLQQETQTTLATVVERYPLQQGLSELIAYLVIAGTDDKTIFEEDHHETIEWQEAPEKWRCARIPRIIFNR